MSEIISRIREIVDYKGISERKFSAEIGVSAGFLSNVSDVGSSKVAKIISIYPEINPVWLLTGQGEMIKTDAGTESVEMTVIEENKRFLDNYFHSRLLPIHYEYTMIRYYNAFSDKRIGELTSLEIDIFQERYNDYAQLVDFLLSLNPPGFFVEKFKTPIPFGIYMSLKKDEFDDDVVGLSNIRLKTILFLLRVKDDAEHYSFLIGNLIKYLSTYKDLIKSHILSDHQDKIK